MRLSIDTLLLLARAGDRLAEVVVVWLYAGNLDAEAWSVNGCIGAGWPGLSNARRW